MLATLIERGRYVPDCVAAFPSVTPVCAASIVTGAAQDEHLIPGMNWFHREEDRYVEYGSSFRAAQRFGIARQLTDTVYNMNRAHLSAGHADGVRVARRRRRAHRRHDLPDVPRPPPPRAPARHRAHPLGRALMRHPVMGPRELFYADIFASRPTGCRSTLGMPGVRDRHSGCVSSLPGRARPVRLPAAVAARQRLALPQARARGAAALDRPGRPAARARRSTPAGGIEQFLDEHAVIAMADHSQAPVTATIDLQDELAELGVLGPGRPGAVQARWRRSRGSPSAPRSARRWSTRCTRPSATRCARSWSPARARASRASTW